MSQHDTPHLNAARRRARKRTLALRDGQHCTYCRAPFEDLRQATIDHVVPISLFRTWRAEHTVLACRPCNRVKADRLPLLFALLLCASTAASTTPTGPAGRLVDAPHAVDALTLARLAHARETTAHAVGVAGDELGVCPVRPTDHTARQSRADLPRSTVRGCADRAPAPRAGAGRSGPKCRISTPVDPASTPVERAVDGRHSLDRRPASNTPDGPRGASASAPESRCHDARRTRLDARRTPLDAHQQPPGQDHTAPGRIGRPVRGCPHECQSDHAAR
ncbi:HNH endonuclease [Streptomyces sp. ISL-11]|nr:HNH endonuclease [Streptomyces sp. ISL-11]